MEWGYLLILSNSVLTCVMTAIRKEYQRKVDATLKTTLTFMLVSSLFVCLIGVAYGCMTDFALIRQADGLVVGLAALFACILTVNTCLCIFGAKYGSLAIITTFATLGTLVISTIYGVIADPLKNRLNGFNIAGLCLALVIVGLSFIAKNRSEEQTKTNGKKGATIFIFLCLAIFLFNGSALSVYSIFTSNRANYNGLNFIFLYLFFCVLLCGIVLGCLFLVNKTKGERVAVKECLGGKPLVCSLLYGTFFFGAEFCALTTTSLLPIVIQAPLSFAVNVVIVAIVDWSIYKQKLSKIQLLQIALAIVCGVLFAL